MALSPEQLSSSLKHLKRAPAPKVPIGSQPKSPEGMGAIDLSSVKLKKTGKRESLIEADIMTAHGKENASSNELDSLFEKRRKMFDSSETTGKPVTLPRVMPKPRRSSSEGEGEFSPNKPRSESFPKSGSAKDTNDNLVQSTGPPTLRPLPTLQSIGRKPPPKPPKPLILTMKIEKNYKNHQVIIAPEVEEIEEDITQNGSFDQGDAVDTGSIEDAGEEIYDDINTETFVQEIKQSNIKPVETVPEEPELIEEDMYDDVEQLAQTVKAELGQNTKPSTDGGSGTDGLNLEDGSGEFGEDFYQPVEGTFQFEQQANGLEEDIEIYDDQIPGDEPAPVQPPPPRESKEDPKAKKERERKERESQKKKEKEEQRKRREEERREKEDKKKKEEERRKREKMDKELKKAHKLKGNEPVLCKGTAKEDISGTGKDLPCVKGSTLEVLVKDNCPTGKWLVKDEQGHYGYVSSDSLLLEMIPTQDESEDLDEDLYECVDTFQSSSLPPPPPISSLPPPTTDEELYDDTLAEDEDLYDDIPGAN